MILLVAIATSSTRREGAHDIYAAAVALHKNIKNINKNKYL